jgi:hypothetical protein
MTVTKEQLEEVGRLMRKGMDEGAIAERMKVDVSVVAEAMNQINSEMELEDAKAYTKLCMKTQEFLEWSWNYGCAEDMRDNNIKDNARWVSDGILRGEDADIEDLKADFLERRTDWNEDDPPEKATMCSSIWWPEEAEVKAMLIDELKLNALAEDEQQKEG